MALSDSDVQKQIQHMMAFIEQVSVISILDNTGVLEIPKRGAITEVDFVFRKPMRKPKRSTPRLRKSSTSRRGGLFSNRGSRSWSITRGVDNF